jgi:hypothetical protein
MRQINTPRFADGGVVRMEPGGLLRSTGNAELDEALAELERQRLRQEEVLRSLGLQGDEEGLSEVSADVGSYRPSPISAAPMTSAGGLPNIRETQNLLGRIRPSLSRQLLDQGAPPSTEDSVDAARRRLALMDAREEARPRGYTPPMTLPSLTSLDPLSTAETPQIAVTGDQTAAPRLVNRDGEQFAEMPDGSLIPLEDLGVSPAELAGADTADLAARPGFAGRDLASERMGAGFDTIGGLGAPMLSSADRTSFGADTAVGGSRRAFDMPTPAGDMETPLVASLTGESGR